MSCYLEVAEIDPSGSRTRTTDLLLNSDSKHALFSVILPNRYKCLINSQTLCDIFLPSGFPDSVTSDYIKYQLYDSLQAFCSSIVGLLSSRAVLEGFGVGDEHASSTKAVLLTVSQDATGRLATILFAWKYGPALAPEAKMYRLSADIFNDIAFVLDCLSPVLPSHIRLASICLAGVMRAICGVCGGASKAALSMHFAKVGNVGELNAKDASQETVIGLLGMLCGSYVLSKIISTVMTWTVLIVLLATHLGLNYLAVRAVVLRTLNRQRANLIYKEFRFEGRMPSPSEVARLEHIFQNPSVIRDSRTGKTLGSILVCGTVEDLTDTISNTYMPDQLWRETFDIFQKESYILLTSPKKPQLVYICFKYKATSEDHLKAWITACEVLHLPCVDNEHEKGHNRRSQMSYVRDSLDKVNGVFLDFLEKAKDLGWDVSTDAIITKPLAALDIILKEKDKKMQ